MILAMAIAIKIRIGKSSVCK